MCPQDRVVSLSRHPAEAQYARRHVSDFCAGLPGDLGSTAQLLTSELVSNAVRHGSSPIELRIGLSSGRLRVDVLDGSGQQPAPQPRALYRNGGRGLLLVDQLASSWGCHAGPRGKSVWFELQWP